MSKGENSWNGLRQHHLVVRRLSSGGYIGLADGDRVASGDLFRRVLLGYASLAGAITLVVLVGFLLGIVNCVVPSTWCMNYYYAGKRTDTVLDLESDGFLSDKLRTLCCRLNRVPSFLRGRSSKLGRLGLGLILLVGVLLSCVSISYIYGGSGAVAPYAFKGHASKFTLVTMTYDARLWNLKMYVSHYSRCASVKEIVVIWNKGPPPEHCVAISGNTNQHYRKRSECLRRFSELYGSLSDRRWEFGGRKDGWDL